MKIAQVIKSDSWGEISPEAFERGIGGREGALVRLATEWAKLGHQVTNFVPTKKASRFEEQTSESKRLSITGFPKIFGYHEYIPISMAQPSLASWPYDAVIAWECPSIYNNEHVIEKQKVRLTHLQVAHFSDGEMEAAQEFSTGVVALSNWARDFLVSSGLQHDNLYVRPNGVNISSYPIDRAMKKPKKVSFVYSSSPDRGLSHLLKMWPQIRKEFKDAKLYVAYGLENYVSQLMWAHSRVAEMCLDIIEGIDQPGVMNLGKIGQKQLAEVQLNATAWLYPADTIQATETGCITAIENMAAGNLCLMSDVDCLESEFGKGFVGGKGKISEYPPPGIIVPLPFDAERWSAATIELINNQKDWVVRRLAARTFAETRDWSKIAPTWIDLFEENRDA